MSNGNELDEIIDGFLIEAQEIFEDLSNGLVLFEKNPEDEELIKSIFRGFHTLKGTAGFLDFPNIEKSAHVMEDLLNQVRQGKRKISSQDIDTIFEGMDILQELLIKIQEDKTDDVDVTDFVNKLRIYLDDIPGEKPAPAKKEVKPTTKAKEKKAVKPKDRSKSEMIDVNITDDSAELVEPFLDDTKDSINRAKKIFDKGEEEEIINTVVQIIDTIKGSSGFIGFEPLEEVSIAFLKIQKGASLTLEPFKIEFDIFNKLVLEIIEDYQQKKKIKSSYKDYVKQADVVTETKEVKEAALKKKPVKEKTVPVEDGLVQGKVYELSEELSELVEVFYIELDEILDSLNQDFVELEKNPGDSELLNRIFRGAHTIKGTSGFIGFDHMVKLTHAMEDCLNKARNNEIYIDESIMDLLLDGIDGIIELKNKFKAKEPISYPVGEYRNKLQEAINNLGEPVEEIKATVGDKEREVAEEKPPDKIPVAEETTVETPEVITLAKEPSIKTDDKEGKDVAKSYLGKFADKTIRVDVERLDSLMDLVGELVLGRNRLVQILNTMQIQGTDRHNLDDLVESTGSVDFLTTEIQGAVMMTRMVPIGRIFSKFPRLVRDLAREAGKKIELKMVGEKTEVDKSVSEDIGDPLVHILRNSVDHGLEPPEERKKAGKPEVGTVQLNAYHEGNSIVIECIDDGRGIDPEKIKKKAIEKGQLTEEEAAKLSKTEIYDLLFKPGFSTAEKITNISGRGVGMDVVKTNIQKLNGIISLNSEVGKGTTLRLQLPLTLAIIQGLVTQVYEEIFIIPLASILETIRIQKKDMYTVKGNYVIRLRDEVLPIIQLEEILDIPHDKTEWKSRYVVVIGLANIRAGIVVDQLIGQKEIVIKTLGSYLGSIRGIGGCSILGDGRVRLIIDIADLITLTKDVRRKIDA